MYHLPSNHPHFLQTLWHYLHRDYLLPLMHLLHQLAMLLLLDLLLPLFTLPNKLSLNQEHTVTVVHLLHV